MKVFLSVESVHGEVFDRSGGPVQVQISLKVDVDRFSKDKKTALFKYKLVKYSRLCQITITGNVVFIADTDEELKELDSYVKKEKPPNQVIQMIIAKTQPLILHIEEEFQVPIVPVIPVALSGQEKNETNYHVPMYQ